MQSKVCTEPRQQKFLFPPQLACRRSKRNHLLGMLLCPRTRKKQGRKAKSLKSSAKMVTQSTLALRKGNTLCIRCSLPASSHYAQDIGRLDQFSIQATSAPASSSAEQHTAPHSAYLYCHVSPTANGSLQYASTATYLAKLCCPVPTDLCMSPFQPSVQSVWLC